MHGLFMLMLFNLEVLYVPFAGHLEFSGIQFRIHVLFQVYSLNPCPLRLY